MSFADANILIVALMELELPDHTIRLCDGGFVNWPARGMFSSEDPIFGTIESAEAVTESISDEAPNGRITLLPPDLTDAADLFQSNAQGSPCWMWMGLVNRDTGIIIGDPELLFSGMLDTMTVRIGQGTRAFDIEFVSSAERLFMVTEGTALTRRWHQQAWAGEKGLDHMTGTGTAVPWGVPDPARGRTTFTNPDTQTRTY